MPPSDEFKCNFALFSSSSPLSYFNFCIQIESPNNNLLINRNKDEKKTINLTEFSLPLS